MFDPTIGGATVDHPIIPGQGFTLTTTTPHSKERKNPIKVGAGGGGEEDDEIFSGDHGDLAALAAQAEAMAQLAESLEETLEMAEMDLQEQDEQWTVTAKLTTHAEDSENHAGDRPKLEEITKKINQIAVKTLQEEEEDEERAEEEARLLAEQSPANEDTEGKLDEKPKEKSAWEACFKPADLDDTKKEEGKTKQALKKQDDYDDRNSGSSSDSNTSSSSSSLSSLNSSQDEDSSSSDDEDGEPNSTHHMSSNKSLSLAEINLQTDEEGESGTLSCSHDVLLKHGVIRVVDPASDPDTYVCDWGRWRQLNRQGSGSTSKQGLNSSSRSSKRKLSEDNHSSSNSQDVSYFDWKAWKRRRGGQQSSTSRTNSLSMSTSNDDGFDVDSVLAKLDEWEMMEEDEEEEDDEDEERSINSRNNGSSSSCDSDSSSSGSGTDDDLSESSSDSDVHESATTTSEADNAAATRPGLKQRSHSLLRKRSPSLRSVHASPMRPPMQKQPADDELDRWKSWQREKRRTGMLKKSLSVEGNLGDPPRSDSTGDDNRKKLSRSHSEKWGKKQTTSQRQPVKRSNTFHVPREAEPSNSPAFDWSAFRKDKFNRD